MNKKHANNTCITHVYMYTCMCSSLLTKVGHFLVWGQASPGVGEPQWPKSETPRILRANLEPHHGPWITKISKIFHDIDGCTNKNIGWITKNNLVCTNSSAKTKFVAATHPDIHRWQSFFSCARVWPPSSVCWLYTGDKISEKTHEICRKVPASSVLVVTWLVHCWLRVGSG